MNHFLYQSPDGLIHECEDGQIANDKRTYVVWTKCEIDVPSNRSFKSKEIATCPKCIKISNKEHIDQL